MAQWRSRTLGHTVRLLRARRSWQDYMPGTHRLVGSRGAKIGEAVRKNAQVDSGSQSSLSGSLGSLVGCALCPPVDRPLDGRRRAQAGEKWFLSPQGAVAWLEWPNGEAGPSGTLYGCFARVVHGKITCPVRTVWSGPVGPKSVRLS